jgi:hypothetical protein
MEEVRLKAASVSVLPVVRGLPRDGDIAAKAVEVLTPDVVALSLSAEELETLRTYRGGNIEPQNAEEEAYVAGLSVWEEPVMPPPCFQQAIAAALTRKIALEAVDMDEETYAEMYTTYVSTMELITQGRLEDRLLKKRFHVSTPEEFVLAWDAEINRTVGFARLQKEREKFMASRLRELAEGTRQVLAVIEVERAKGVLAALRG